MRDRDLDPDRFTYACPGCGEPMSEREVETSAFFDDDGPETATFDSAECMERWRCEREIADEHPGQTWTHACGDRPCAWGCGEAWVPNQYVYDGGDD